MSGEIAAMSSQIANTQLSMRMDHLEQRILEKLSNVAGCSLADMQEIYTQLLALSEQDRKQIESVVKRVLSDESKQQTQQYLGCVNNKTLFLLTSVVAMAYAASTMGTISGGFRSGTANAGNWLTTTGIQCLTVGKCAGRAFVQLPADAEKATDLFQKVFTGIAQFVNTSSEIPRGRNEGQKFEHQTNKDALVRQDQDLSNSISQAGSRRDDFIRQMQQMRQQMHDTIMSMVRSA